MIAAFNMMRKIAGKAAAQVQYFINYTDLAFEPINLEQQNISYAVHQERHLSDCQDEIFYCHQDRISLFKKLVAVSLRCFPALDYDRLIAVCEHKQKREDRLNPSSKAKEKIHYGALVNVIIKIHDEWIDGKKSNEYLTKIKDALNSLRIELGSGNYKKLPSLAEKDQENQTSTEALELSRVLLKKALEWAKAEKHKSSSNALSSTSHSAPSNVCNYVSNFMFFVLCLAACFCLLFVTRIGICTWNDDAKTIRITDCDSCSPTFITFAQCSASNILEVRKMISDYTGL